MLRNLQRLHNVKDSIFSRCVHRGYFLSYSRCTNVKLENSKITSKVVGNSYEVPEGEMKSCDISNGMRLVCECKDSFTTTVGCFLPAGAIYEMPEERGSSLFLEHLLFRRTTHRSQHDLEAELEEIGGTIKTLATRDMFLFYGTVVSYNVEKLIELFADVILNGVICNEDVKAEKSVILQGLINMESDYEKVVMDYLPNIAYQDTALAKSIYPETKVIRNFCAESLTNFRRRLFKTCFITMVSSGSISLQELHEIVCKHFVGEAEECQPLPGNFKLESTVEQCEYRFSGAELRLRDDDEELGYVALGFEGPHPGEQRDHITLTVAKEIVGSWDKTYGGANHNAPYLAHLAFNTDLCYMYKSFFLDWSRTSIWGCYFVCDKLRLQDMLDTLQQKWMRLCTTITKKEVARAVNQCKMRELLILNHPTDRFCDIINSLFKRGYYVPVQKRLINYEEVTAEGIREIVGKYIYDQSPAVIALGRIENLPDYCNIRNGTYLLRY